LFGIPSVHNLPIYDALRREGRIRVVNVCHEQCAAAAADGYSRTTGRLGVCLTSTGPGAANAMGGQLEACVSSSPVLHLTGQIDSRFLGQRRGFIHEVPDQLAMLASLSKAAYRARSTAAIASTLADAAAQAMIPPRGPVSVEIPIDFQYGSTPLPLTPPEASSAGRRTDETATAGDISRVAELVALSRRPVVWAGGGAVTAGAGDEVAELVRRLGAGLLTSPNGRGIVSEDHACCIGNLSWDPDVRALCREADLLIAIGTRFQGPNTENWKMSLPTRLVQIDVDPSVPGRNYPAEAAIIGDAKAVTAALLQQLDRMGVPEVLAEASWARRVATTAVSARARLRATLGPQAGLLDAVAGCLDPTTIVVKDSTISAYTWGNRLLPVRRPRTSIVPNGFAIGLGLPHAIGAAIGSEGAQVILLVGDGGLLLSATELATLARERLSVLILVFVDGAYGVVRNIQQQQYGPQASFGVDIGRPDFCTLAAAFGIGAERVGSVDAFATGIKRAVSVGGPYLLEVDLDAIGPMSVTYTGTSRPPAAP
jgi:acetolactate synthase-1/2/3 large subunit